MSENEANGEGGYMRPGHPPASSDYYGSYGQNFSSQAYQINPWQVSVGIGPC